jgi:ribosomal protein L6P/L9E
MNPLVRSSTFSPSFRCPSKTITSPHFGHFSSIKLRSIASSASRHSYIGSTPIPVPPDITLERVILSKGGSTSSTTGASSSRGKDNSSSEERLIIRGAKGETSIKLYNFMRFLLPNASPQGSSSGSVQEGVRELKVKSRNPPCPPSATADAFSFSPAPSSTAASTTTDDAAQVTLFVENPAEKQQRMLWGLTRTLIANAIVGQSEGYTLPIYLIGVGYRATLEVDQASVAAASPSNTPQPSTSSAASSSPQSASTVVATPVGSTVTHETYPRRRLVMRLGFSHVIYVSVPPDLRVTVRSPTIILVWSRDKQRVGQFCADVRALRKPEVYKGKVCWPAALVTLVLTSYRACLWETKRSR